MLFVDMMKGVKFKMYKNIILSVATCRFKIYPHIRRNNMYSKYGNRMFRRTFRFREEQETGS